MSNRFVKKKLICVLFFCVGCFFAGFYSAFAKEITLGGKNGWNNIYSSQNVTTGTGRFGYESVQLATNSFNPDEYTDFLVNFESPEKIIFDGAYGVLSNHFQISDQTINGKACGLSRNTGGMSVKGEPGSFFGSEGLTGSFSIEFWICPSIVENGEIIFDWETSKIQNDELVYQRMNAGFEKGKLVWTLSNVFNQFVLNDGSGDVILKGKTEIIPDKWSYHVLSYDCETGLLEYLVDGVTQDLAYITSTANEDGEIYLAVLGTPSDVDFCSEYTGKIDDIRILRRPYAVADFQSAENAGKVGHVRYVPTGGKFVSEPIMVSGGSVLNSLNAQIDVPQQTEVSFYVRSGENFYNWSDEYPEWKPVVNEEKIDGVSGLYFQVMAELLPDGAGEKTPSVTQISLDFTELSEPLPPFWVKAVAGNGCVNLSWNYSVDDSAGGYYVYYGTRPGEYLSRIAIEGESPIDAGNVSSFVVSGLENGRIYYFAVAAYSVYNSNVVGELSTEVFARPLARLK